MLGPNQVLPCCFKGCRQRARFELDPAPQDREIAACEIDPANRIAGGFRAFGIGIAERVAQVPARRIRMALHDQNVNRHASPRRRSRPALF